MEIVTSLDNTKFTKFKTGVALGNFDGVHIGHQTLIVNLVDECRRNNLKSVIYTFKNHPKMLTTKNATPKKIISDEQKFNILSEMGIDYLFFIDFNEYHRTLEPESFIKDILIEKLNMAHVIVGFDYRFGFKAKGDVKLLNQLKSIYLYGCTIIEPISIQGETISSTEIRNLISNGNINKSNLFLGRKFSVIGEVVRGKGLGKQFGFPTANISLFKDIIIPSPGVYITKCILRERIYQSITSVGVNPTLGDNPISIETHIINYNEDIYGSQLEVFFYQKIRDEMRFDSIEKLISQVNKDILITKKFFAI